MLLRLRRGRSDELLSPPSVTGVFLYVFNRQ